MFIVVVVVVVASAVRLALSGLINIAVRLFKQTDEIEQTSIENRTSSVDYKSKANSM
jgi:hypothetical protein